MGIRERARSENLDLFSAPPPGEPGAGSEPRRPWEMTRDEFDDSEYGEHTLRIIGERVIAKVGSDDPEEILRWYVDKYGIRMKVRIGRIDPSVSGGFDTQACTAFFSEGDGQVSIAVIDLDMPDTRGTHPEIIANLRHEIEHVIDYDRRHFTPENHAKNLGIGLVVRRGESLGDKLREFHRGHHHHYDHFELDYLRRSLVAEAIEAGEPVPDHVLDDFPELKPEGPKPRRQAPA